jgi:hypothetical protein
MMRIFCCDYSCKEENKSVPFISALYFFVPFISQCIILFSLHNAKVSGGQLFARPL